MNKIIKKIKLQYPTFFGIILNLSTFAIRSLSFRKRIKGRENKLHCKGTLIMNSKLIIRGNINKITISRESILLNCRIFISGNNNEIYIGNKVKLFDTELWIEDENNKMIIGKSTSINGAHIALTEFNNKIEIGENCLFSKNIDIRNGDSHSIIDLTTNIRINYAGNIDIGNHVWLGKFVKILKGTVIGENCVIGINSLVNSTIEPNSLAVGSPAKSIKRNITWKHERIYEK